MKETPISHKNIPDEELARTVQTNPPPSSEGERAFAEIMSRYEPRLMRYGSKFLFDSAHIEDSVQDVFIKVYQNMQSFDAARKFSPWIYRIAHNEFVNALKKLSRGAVPVFDFDTLVAHEIYEDPTDEEKEKEEMIVLLNKGLKTLSAAYREVMILRYLEDLSYQEIADVLAVPVGTVGVRILRARSQLREYVKRQQSL